MVLSWMTDRLRITGLNVWGFMVARYPFPFFGRPAFSLISMTESTQLTNDFVFIIFSRLNYACIVGLTSRVCSNYNHTGPLPFICFITVVYLFWLAHVAREVLVTESHTITRYPNFYDSRQGQCYRMYGVQ